MRVNSREHVFLYISKFGTNRLPQIYAATKDGATTAEGVSGLVTWPMAIAEGTGDKDGSVYGPGGLAWRWVAGC